jgi:hypothetical protein
MRTRSLLAAIAGVGLLSGCASSEARPVEWDGTYDFGTPGAVESTLVDVEYYPACGNEILAIDGNEWYPFTPENPDDFPDPALDILPVIDGLPSKGNSAGHISTDAAVGAVAAPGPGDAIGTLVVYGNDLAYWVSDSRNLDTWLTASELEYNWVC